MNYIKLLNAAFERFYFDDRLNPAHISLYLAIFQEWNCNRFALEISVNRRDLMRAAKIGSKSTYHRCMVNLHEWSYLHYLPSRNPYKGSKVQMTVFETTDETVMSDYDPILEQVAEQYYPKNNPSPPQSNPNKERLLKQYSPSREPPVGPNINSTKQEKDHKIPKDRQVICRFFEENGFPVGEATKFFDYYQNNNWKTRDGKGVRNWQALALSWMKHSYGIFSKTSGKRKDNLKTSKVKDYDQPL